MFIVDLGLTMEFLRITINRILPEFSSNHDVLITDNLNQIRYPVNQYKINTMNAEI